MQELGFLVLAGLQTEREVLTEGLHSIAWSGDHAKTRRPKKRRPRGQMPCMVGRVRSLPVEYGYFVIANPVGVKQSYNTFNKIASSGKERPPRIVSDRSVAEMPVGHHARTLSTRQSKERPEILGKI